MIRASLTGAGGGGRGLFESDMWPGLGLESSLGDCEACSLGSILVLRLISVVLHTYMYTTVKSRG
jgi:hypothetical protein